MCEFPFAHDGDADWLLVCDVTVCSDNEVGNPYSCLTERWFENEGDAGKSRKSKCVADGDWLDVE